MLFSNGIEQKWTILKVLTVDVHLNSLFLFLMPTGHGAQVRMFILKTHRAQGQCGCGPVTPHLSTQRTVCLGSPRERWRLAASDTTCQHNWVTNLSSNLGSRGDLNNKQFFWEEKEKDKTKVRLFSSFTHSKIWSFFFFVSFFFSDFL